MRRFIPLAALVVFVAAGHLAAQNEVQNNFKYNSGQDVQPVFEGWSKNADGSFNMHFGYLNRNYVETPAIPVGVNNSSIPAERIAASRRSSIRGRTAICSRWFCRRSGTRSES